MSTEETVKLARSEYKDSMYEPKQNQKAIRILTVGAYVFFVSLAAITLSMYYVFIWDPSAKPHLTRVNTNCADKIIIPESLAVQLANSTESVSADVFLRNFFRRYQQAYKQTRNIPERMIEVKEVTALPILLTRIETSIRQHRPITTTAAAITQHPPVYPPMDSIDPTKEDAEIESAEYEASGSSINSTIHFLDQDEDDTEGVKRKSS